MIAAISVGDWIVIALLALSILVGLLRGFIREVVSVVGWVVGAYLAVQFAVSLGARIPLEVEWPLAKTLLAGALIVVVCVFAAALIGWLLQRVLAAVKLSAADRILGGIFGLARGLLILGLLVFFAHDTAVAQQQFWRDSIVLPQAEAAVRFALKHLPRVVEPLTRV